MYGGKKGALMNVRDTVLTLGGGLEQFFTSTFEACTV